jgi:adenosylhomocysteine nucleosidase
VIAFLGALRQELAGLQRHVALKKVLAEPACILYSGEFRGREILLAQTGMGRARAEAGTRLVLDRYAATTVISFGFAGALAPNLRVGDIVLCSTLHGTTAATPGNPGPIPYHSDGRLLGLAQEALQRTTVRFLTGNSVTVPQVVCSPKEKEELARAVPAHLVDMESYWIARIAAEQRVPFLSLRAISDTHLDLLPPFDRFLAADGRWRWREAASFFVRHPQHLALLVDLARNTRQARTTLTAALGCLVAVL